MGDSMGGGMGGMGGMGGAFDFDLDSIPYTTVILGVACVSLLMSTIYFYKQVSDLESGTGNGSVVAACTSRCCFADTVFDAGYKKCVAKVQACEEGEARQNGTCVPISKIEEEAAQRAADKVKGPQGAAIGLSVLAAVILFYMYLLPPGSAVVQAYRRSGDMYNAAKAAVYSEYNNPVATGLSERPGQEPSERPGQEPSAPS